VLVIPVVAALIVTGGVIAPKSDGPSTAPATAGSGPSAPPASVARARGGPGPDVLRGGPKVNRLFGRRGADRLYGRRGNDWLFGGPGKDLLVGGRGRDHLLGGPGPDLIRADGRDRVRAGSGNDVVVVRAGRLAFTVSCGRGHDTLIVVRAKKPTKRAVRRRAKGCEKIQRRTSLPPAPPGGLPGGPPTAGGVAPTSTTGGVVPESPLPAPSIFVSTGGADGNPCSAAAPCRSFDRAYHAAAPGQVVQVAAGSYPEQVMSADSSKGSGGNVTFVPAPGASVSVNYMRFGRYASDFTPNRVEFRRITIGGFISQRGTGLSFVNSVIDGTFNIIGTSNVSIRGGSVGGTVGDNPAIATWEGDPQDVVPTGILIDRVLFHDMVMKTAADHMECLHVLDATALTVSNSYFARCDTFDLNVGVKQFGLHDVLIENNVFEPSRARFGQSYYSLSLRLGTGVTIRNNSFAQDWAGPSEGDSISNWRVVGNAGGGSRCDDRVSYSHNVWDDWKCSGTDKRADPRFVNRDGGDLRLRDGSPAINAGDPGDHPAVDITGKDRGSAPDAGAYER
jgi:hypothetical protein